MNLKVYLTSKIDRVSMVQSVLVNTGYLTNIEQNGTKTDFVLKYDNFERYFTVSADYESVIADTMNYDAGTKIDMNVVGIDNNEVNRQLMVNVDLIVYAWRIATLSHVMIVDRPTPRIYKTYDSLSQLELRGNFSLGERHYMTYQQTIIRTDLVLTENCKIYQNGSLQGLISMLDDYTIQDRHTLIYGGTFYGGEEIFILP